MKINHFEKTAKNDLNQKQNANNKVEYKHPNKA
jgi:hypothetical protein